MKKSDAVPGAKVLASYAGAYSEYFDEENAVIPYQYSDGGYADLVGVIRSKEASPGHVWVKWIDGDYRDNLDEEMEVDLKLLVLESDKTDIEKDYKSVSKEIKAKMKEAGKLVKEANALSMKANLGPIGQMWDQVRPLVNAMDESGWRSSSWGC